MTRRGAFTLIEVLVVVAIIALLIAIAMPSLSYAKRISRRTYCLNNLHEVGIGIQAYCQVNQEKFPVLCQSWTLEQLKPEEEQRPPISRGLKRELGNRSKVLECPADVISEPDPLNPALRVGARYYDFEETSYEWRVQFNGVHRRTKKLEVEGFLIPINTMALLCDFDAFHAPKTAPKSRNYLYPDLHVESDKK